MEENMFKKFVLSLMAALLITVSITSAAFAAEQDPPGIVKMRGEVINVNLAAGKFQLEKPDGEIMTFFVDENTRFRGRVENLDDLQVGWTVGVAAHEGKGDGEGGELLAVLVIAIDPSELIKVRGEITRVDPGTGTYKLQKPDGTEMTFIVDGNTRYSGQINSLEDLQVGWKAAVVAKKTDDGSLLTLALVAGDAPELVKAKGVVTAVDPGAGQFEIKKSDGITVRYFVNEKTRYQGQLSSLDEMQVGWRAAVAAKADEDGKLWAVLVIAGTRPEIIRAQGTVSAVAVGAGKFKLTKPDGTVLTIFVDENTKFRGQVESLSDLINGWRAGVVVVEQSDGKLLARLVMAGEPRAERPPAEDTERPLGNRPLDSLTLP
jgi:hypothetical protein